MEALNSWNVNPGKAKEIQERLRSKIKIIPLNKNPELICGCDVSFEKNGNKIYAGVVVLDFPALNTVERQYAEADASFPYIPGYLSFREIPVLLQAFRKISHNVDLIVCDGQGLAHPRNFGLACHLGLVLGLPSVGCAKSHLVGDFSDPGFKKGDFSSLIFQEKKIGIVLRSRDYKKPVFISPGHMINIDDSYRIIMSCLGKYRIPEPTRQAHILVNAFRKENLGRLK